MKVLLSVITTERMRLSSGSLDAQLPAAPGFWDADEAGGQGNSDTGKLLLRCTDQDQLQPCRHMQLVRVLELFKQWESVLSCPEEACWHACWQLCAAVELGHACRHRHYGPLSTVQPATAQ